MKRVIASVVCTLVVVAAGCSSGNDRPDTGDAAAATTTTGHATTSAPSGPFGNGSDTTTTTAGEDGGGGNGGTGGGGGTGGSGGAGTGSGTGTGTGTVEPSSPVDASTPSDLSDALEGCTNYADVGAGLQQPGTSAEGTCEFGGEIVNLYLFADAAAQRTFVEDGAFFDCSFIVAFGGGGATYYVAGDKWIARPGTEAVARDMAAALDGEVASYVCEA